MLVLSRKVNQVIHIGDNIRVVIVDIEGCIVRVGIDAPKNIQILRDDAVKKTPNVL
jgi:carbon storage regulator